MDSSDASKTLAARRAATRDERPGPRAAARRHRQSVAALGLIAAALFAPLQMLPGGAAGAVPYTDAHAQGFLGLCNTAGVQVTSGKLADTPFAWRVVSSTPAVAPYDADSRTATLFAYQPRQGFLPGEWSGEALTASARYSNPAAPMAAATNQDPSLGSFVKDFPPSWDGFVQLRILLGAAGMPPLTRSYPTLDIQVTGSTWKAVGGGSVDCHSGTAVSLETIVLPTTTTTTGAATSTMAPATTPAKRTHAHRHATTTLASGSGSSSSASPAIWVILGLAVLAGVTGGTVVWRRRRTPPPDEHPDV